jgi:antitoxin CptB
MIKLAKLYWQCRRGTQELDFLLLRYLDTHYVQANNVEQASFIELLALEDDVLIELLLSDVEVESVAMTTLIGKIAI